MKNQANETLTVVRSQNVNLDNEYVQWLHEIKQRFRNAQIKAAVKVNSEQLLFNWRLGRDLVIRRAEEKWGKGIVEQVSLDLQCAKKKSNSLLEKFLFRFSLAMFHGDIIS